jgi:hypothetical protein
MVMTSKQTLIHPGLRFPYESSWLLYLKVLQWNSFPDFRRLLHAFNVETSKYKSNNVWWNSAGFPLHRLESSLGISFGSLKLSFVDGWFPLPKYGELPRIESRSRPPIRHCAECIRYGYHSVLFYFDRFSQCPWHHRALEVCNECTAALGKNCSTAKKIYELSGACEHLDLILDVSATSAPPREFFELVRATGDTFRDWVGHTIDLIGHAAYKIIADKSDSGMDKTIALDFLTKKFGSPSFNYEAKKEASLIINPCLTMVRIDVHCRAINKGHPVTDPLRLSPSIKCVRRYIFKKYMRLHVKCLNRLRELAENEWYDLDVTKICPCALAYVLVVAKFMRVTPYKLLAMRSAPRKEDSSYECHYEWGFMGMLLKFHEQWNILLSVEKSGWQRISCVDRFSTLVWNLLPGIYYSGRFDQYANFQSNFFFLEDPKVSIEQNRVLCLNRRNLPLNIGSHLLELPLLNSGVTVLCVLCNPSATRSEDFDDIV